LQLHVTNKRARQKYYHLRNDDDDHIDNIEITGVNEEKENYSPQNKTIAHQMKTIAHQKKHTSLQN